MNFKSLSRRRFLAQAGRCACGLAAGSALSGRAAAAVQPGVEQISDHLYVFRGPINVGIIRDGDRAMLVDCGDRRVLEILDGLHIRSVKQALFTHHHRDQACAAAELAAAGAMLVVPAAERSLFDAVEDYWNDPKQRWCSYGALPRFSPLAESAPVHATVAEGDKLRFGPAEIRVLATPGHTRGSLSYIVEVDGRRVAFCGDAIYDAGQIWDIYSLQDGGGEIDDYHGFMGSRKRLLDGLARLVREQPDLLIPSHGRPMHDPAKAIGLLAQRVEKCYEHYVAISALRHYLPRFPRLFRDYRDLPGQMEISPQLPVPEGLLHKGTTWVLRAADRSALVMDCGSPHIVKWLQSLVAQGDISRVEGLWITHYHSDHVAGIADFRRAFDCPCIADSHVAEVISNPSAWRLPCLFPEPARVDRITADAQSWPWREFKLTAYHLPGQTRYHGGLLAEQGDLRMFFIGDSFTPSGIDDYCAGNRNWLGLGVGYDYCIALVEQLQPTHLFNPHVEQPFGFTPEQCRQMRANLAERERLFGELLPWEHPNFGIDRLWVRAFPYEQQTAAGSEVQLELVVTNHAAKPLAIAARPVLPKTWGGDHGQWSTAQAPAKAETPLALRFRVPKSANRGRRVIPIDVHLANRELPQFSEAVVVVK